MSGSAAPGAGVAAAMPGAPATGPRRRIPAMPGVRTAGTMARVAGTSVRAAGIAAESGGGSVAAAAATLAGLGQQEVDAGAHGPRLMTVGQRSEERRVGKECRSRWSPDH